MIPVVQSRTGKHNGTCFRAALASILELGEQDVPDFGGDSPDERTYWDRVDGWLAGRGLRYKQVPIVKGAAPPLGWHTIEGLSPRGGNHAVVGHDGKFVWDPHPAWDDPRRGLVEPRVWGLLLPLSKMQRAEDAARKEYVRDQRPSRAEAEQKLAKIRVYKPEGGKRALLPDAVVKTIAMVETPMSHWGRPDSEAPYTVKYLQYGVFESGKIIGTIHKTTNGRVEFNAVPPSSYRVQGNDGLTTRRHGETKRQYAARMVQNDRFRDELERLLRKPRGSWTDRDIDRVEELASLLEFDESDKYWHATDASLRGKELLSAVEPVYEKHDEVKYDSRRAERENAETAYRAAERDVASLVRDAESLLSRSRISDKPAWRERLARAKVALEYARRSAAAREWPRALGQQEYALTVAHHVLDALRGLARRTGAKDVERHSYGKALLAEMAANRGERFVDKKELRSVPVAKLVDTQSYLRDAKVKQLAATPGALAPITVRLVGGDYYVVDGHHRAAAAKLRGDRTIMAEVGYYAKAKDVVSAWRKTADGGWLSPDGRWKVRNTSFLKPMFWLYDTRTHTRYTPTGKYEDAVHFATAAEAKRFAESLSNKAKDALTTVPPFNLCDTITLNNGKRATVIKVTPARDLFGEPEWHVLVDTGDAVIVKQNSKERN